MSFSYDVTDVSFSLQIIDRNNTQVKLYPNSDWVLSGTRKKSLTKTPVEFDLAKGEYKLIIKHQFSSGEVRTRFDSTLTVF
jgi:hypothetical protein